MYALVCVDDILITGNKGKDIDDLISKMNKLFALKILGLVHQFLGIEITRTAQGLHLCQDQCINDLLKNAELQNAKTCRTPMVTGQKLMKPSGDTFKDGTLYRSMIGSLQYVTITRPDIAYSVRKLSQYMNQPSKDHWIACKRILRYLKRTLTTGLIV